MGDINETAQVVQESIITLKDWATIISLVILVLTTFIGGIWKITTKWRQMGIELEGIRKDNLQLRSDFEDHKKANQREFEEQKEINKEILQELKNIREDQLKIPAQIIKTLKDLKYLKEE